MNNVYFISDGYTAMGRSMKGISVVGLSVSDGYATMGRSMRGVSVMGE